MEEILSNIHNIDDTHVSDHHLQDVECSRPDTFNSKAYEAAKAHKKISGQCYSIETSKYLTTLLTVIQTASLQGINTLNLMNELMNNRWVPPTKN